MYIATLVEHYSHFVMLVKVESKETAVVTRALKEAIGKLSERMMKTLTWDRGSEMPDHEWFSVETDVDMYFCDPASPWQRGSNENTNDLLRQYFPKGKVLSIHGQERLDEVACKLNKRPRKTLNWSRPVDILSQTFALTT